MMLLAAVRHGGRSFSLAGSVWAAALPEGKRCSRPESISDPARGGRRVLWLLADQQVNTLAHQPEAEQQADRNDDLILMRIQPVP